MAQCLGGLHAKVHSTSTTLRVKRCSRTLQLRELISWVTQAAGVSGCGQRGSAKAAKLLHTANRNVIVRPCGLNCDKRPQSLSDSVQQAIQRSGFRRRHRTDKQTFSIRAFHTATIAFTDIRANIRCSRPHSCRAMLILVLSGFTISMESLAGHTLEIS